MEVVKVPGVVANIMPPSEAQLLQAHHAARAGRTTPRPREALPRKLQACMHELLSVNERYHQVLHENKLQQQELTELRAEVQKLRTAFTQTEERCALQQRRLNSEQEEAEALRSAHSLQGARCAAADAEKGELSQLLETCMAQLAVQQDELAWLHRQIEVGEAAHADSWTAGFEEGKAQREAEAKSRVRRIHQHAKATAQTAFEQGRQRGTEEQASALLREQAQRRLLLHRAEEARLQHNALETQLQRERRAKSAAQGRLLEMEQRLSSVRWHKGALEGELLATRTAHAQAGRRPPPLPSFSLVWHGVAWYGMV